MPNKTVHKNKHIPAVFADAIVFPTERDAAERSVLAPMLTPRQFPAQAVICAEGEEADRMWIIRKGSVSVLLGQANGTDARRIASMGAGTTVGEMAMLEGG